ncbi:MAG: alpha/beta hydrolase, partial [Candidatus Gracilibacteria bacterium]
IVIEKFIEKLGLKDIILWGHSNGGAISIKIVNNKKINISRLILNNSAGIRNDKKRSLKRKTIGLLIKPFKILKNIPGFHKIREYFYRAIGGQDYLNAEKNPYLKQTYLNMISSDLSNDLDKINLNTLLIWGREDKYTPLSDGLKMRNNIKKAKIVILDNEKHGIHINSPEKLVNTFLNNI